MLWISLPTWVCRYHIILSSQKQGLLGFGSFWISQFLNQPCPSMFRVSKNLLPSWQLLEGRCTTSAHHPHHLQKDLTKSNCKSNMTYKSLVMFYVFGYILKTRYKNLKYYTWNPQISPHFPFKKISPKKEKRNVPWRSTPTGLIYSTFNSALISISTRANHISENQHWLLGVHAIGLEYLLMWLA